jgi:hypothetical protein
MLIDVFLDTGVTVDYQGGADPDSDAGLWQVKRLARAKLLKLLLEGQFDITCEPADGLDGEGEQ